MDIKHIEKLADAKYEECAAEVIRHIRELGPEHRTSGDDSPYADVWEEFKSQVQDAQSIFFDAYVATIEMFCAGVVNSLTPTEFRLLWFWSDGYVEWDEDNDPEPPYMREDVSKELYQRVCDTAVNEDLAHLAAEDEDEDEDDEDEDNEEDETEDEEDAPPYNDVLPLFDAQ